MKHIYPRVATRTLAQFQGSWEGDAAQTFRASPPVPSKSSSRYVSPFCRNSEIPSTSSRAVDVFSGELEPD